MSFEIVYHHDAVERDIPALPRTMRTRIKTAIDRRLATEPAACGKPLRYSLHSLWSLRVGDYRIIYKITGEEVLILRIGHRKEVYKSAGR